MSSILNFAIQILRLLDRRDPNHATAEERFQQAERFLILRYERPLGSAINAAPLFEALRRVRPNCYIAVLCNKTCHNVLKNNPFIDQFIVTQDPNKNFIEAVFGALRGILSSKSRFDCLISTCDNRPRIEAMALLLGRCLRVGHGMPRTYHLPFIEDTQLSVIANHLDVISNLGAVGSAPIPRLYYTDEDIAVVKRTMISARWEDARPKIALVTQTSGGQPTDWYNDRFAAVADRLFEQYQAKFLFLGSADQASAIDTIRAAMRCDSINLAGRTTISELAAALSLCQLIITLDTGTMHLGRGVNVPMIVIAPAWQPAHRWLPRDIDGIRVLRRDDIPCALCYKFSCATRECLDEITVEDVVAAAEQLLERGYSKPLQVDPTPLTHG